MDPEVQKGFQLIDKVFDALQAIVATQHDEIVALQNVVIELNERINILEGRTP
jgi:hypothetical protein